MNVKEGLRRIRWWVRYYGRDPLAVAILLFAAVGIAVFVIAVVIADEQQAAFLSGLGAALALVTGLWSVWKRPKGRHPFLTATS